jgi:hypothetical protein
LQQTKAPPMFLDAAHSAIVSVDPWPRSLVKSVNP